MKKIILLILIMPLFLTSCSENPVRENQKADISNTWSLAYKSAKPFMLDAGPYGNSLNIGYGDFSKCSFIRIKVNYIATYRPFFKPPGIGVTGVTGGLLWQTKYSTLDTVLKRSSIDSTGSVFIHGISAKVYIDTVVIMKGYPNF